LHTVPRKELGAVFGGGATLATEFHHPSRGRSRVGRKRNRSGSGSGGKKLSTIHRS